MSRVTALVLLVPLLVRADGVAAPAPLQVWCMGDSIVSFYAGELARLEPAWNVIAAGLGGERTEQGRARLEKLLGERPAPDVAIVVYGANDVVAGCLWREAGIGPETAAANIHAMAMRLRAAGVVPIVALPVGAPPMQATYPPETRATLASLRRGFASLRKQLRRERPHVDFRLTRHELFVDVVHPAAAGAALLAARARAAIRRTLVERTAAPAHAADPP